MPIHDWQRIQVGIFHHFHHEWISTLSRTLNSGLLPPEYYALDDQVAGSLPPSPPGVLTVATAPPQVRFTAATEAEHYARKGKVITIRHSSGDEVVAVIEIVSPGNKASRHALRAFVDKAVELLNAGVHLLLIDLFAPGPRDPQGIHAAIWSEISDDPFQLPLEEPLTLVAYTGGIIKRAYIEPVAVGRELPDMPLFLETEVYVPVPLEATYRAAFEDVPQRWRAELEPPPTS